MPTATTETRRGDEHAERRGARRRQARACNEPRALRQLNGDIHFGARGRSDLPRRRARVRRRARAGVLRRGDLHQAVGHLPRNRAGASGAMDLRPRACAHAPQRRARRSDKARCDPRACTRGQARLHAGLACDAVADSEIADPRCDLCAAFGRRFAQALGGEGDAFDDAVSAARRSAAPRSLAKIANATAYEMTTATTVTSTMRPVSVRRGLNITPFRPAR